MVEGRRRLRVRILLVKKMSNRDIATLYFDSGSIVSNLCFGVVLFSPFQALYEIFLIY